MKAAALRSEPALEDIFKLVESDLKEVEAGLRKKIRSAAPIVEEINRYIHDSGGKRLRPTLVLLCSKLLGYRGQWAPHLGVIIELIHAATLVHDDIIDNAKLRRGRPAVHTVWGNQATVLMGDWLYMTAFHLALDVKEMRVLDLLINVTRKLVEGELLQLELQWRLNITREDQLEICMRKTAYLFGGCCRLAGMAAQRSPEDQGRLWEYGQSLGIAYQLIDDLLDYTSTQSLLGKPALKDLEEGKVTMPIIYLMQRADRQDADFVRQVVEDRDFSPESKERIIEMAVRYGTLRDVRKEAEGYAAQARDALSHFPDSPYRQALLHLPQFVLDRKK